MIASGDSWPPDEEASPEEAKSGEQRNDSKAFEALVRPLMPGWILAARRVLGDLAESEDAVLLALGKLWELFKSASPAVQNFPAFALRVVTNQALDRLRERERRARRDAAAAADVNAVADGAQLDPLLEVLTRESRRALDEVLESLPPEERRVVQLHAFGGLTFAEVARIIGAEFGGPRSEEWAKKRYQRACAKLRDRAALLVREGRGR